jgi:hypothetical protein
MLEPKSEIDHVAAMDDSVSVINELLAKTRNSIEDERLKANAEHLLIMSEKLGVIGYKDIANQALGL